LSWDSGELAATSAGVATVATFAGQSIYAVAHELAAEAVPARIPRRTLERLTTATAVCTVGTRHVRRCVDVGTHNVTLEVLADVVAGDVRIVRVGRSATDVFDFFRSAATSAAANASAKAVRVVAAIVLGAQGVRLEVAARRHEGERNRRKQQRQKYRVPHHLLSRSSS
jgi:hypothetical protein